MNRPARTHRRGPERVLWAAWLTLLLSLPAVAQDEPNGGNDIPTCDGGGTSPITLTWLEAPTPDASSRLSGTTANLLLTNGTREDLEAQVVLDLDRGGESFQLTLPAVFAGEMVGANKAVYIAAPDAAPAVAATAAPKPQKTAKGQGHAEE